MKKFSIILLSLSFVCTTLYAQGTSFNYNKWKAEQEKTTTSKEKRYTFDENLLKPNCVYLDGFIQAGHVHGPGVTLGGYLKNINGEVSYIYGLSESYQVERLFADAHHAFTYRPSYIGAKVGYGLGFFGCLRLTPQVGIGWVMIRGTQANETTTRATETCNATCLSGGMKVELAFTKHFSCFVVPEYQTKIGNSASYDIFTDTTGEYVSPNSSTKDLVNWTEGFRIRFGLQVTL